jgi:hypothetical protein
MQLAEQGKLNLNDDVNKYLKKFQVKNKYKKSITIANLLTHTDGFDVVWTIGGATRCQSSLPSLEQFLIKNLPQQVLPPGEVYVYGDGGLALAGYLVEIISGVPFNQYIEQNILKPLDMRHSSFQQPLPPALADDLALGYGYKNGTYFQRPFTCNKSVPTIAMSATATDMAHFMIAHLQGGRYGASRILNETRVQEMHRQHYTNFPSLPRTPGSTYGFYERFQNNQRVIEHGGSMAGYTNLLFLMPDQNLGFYFAYNNNTIEDKVREDLIEQFLDRYYPGQEKLNRLSPRQPSAEFKQLSRQIDGCYRFIRYSRHSIVKSGRVLLQSKPDFRLQTSRDGTLTLFPEKTQWVEVAPLLFRSPDSNIHMGFRQDHQGRITAMSLSNYVFSTYEKLPWYESTGFQLALAGFYVLTFLSGCWIWAINPLIARKRKQSFPVPRITRLAQFLVGLISALNLLFLIGMLLAVFQINFWEFFLGMPPIIIALLYLPIVSTGLTTGLPIVALLAWRDKRWSVVGRLHYLLIALAASVFILCLNYWNLLGF